MKEILLLVLLTTSQFYMPPEPTSGLTYMVVSSPEEAAIRVWEHQHPKVIEQDLIAELYRINFEDGTVEQVAIPILMFADPAMMTPNAE